MTDPELIKCLNWIRVTFLSLTRAIDEVESFRHLRTANEKLDSDLKALFGRIPDRVRVPFTDKFVVAIVGNSSNGKTTILDEMFPSLHERGWLVHDVTDTTSQSLRIEYAPEGSAEAKEIIVNSWDLQRIRELFTDEDIVGQNQLDQISVSYGESSIEVDGMKAKMDIPEFKFPKKLELKPFPTPYRVTEEEQDDPRFIRALTTKPIAAEIDTGPILFNGSEYNSLQLRAVVKDVTMKDSFARIKEWTDLSEEELRKLVFVDTPGLGTAPNANDEILRHPLGVKSQKIALDLLENDELDIIIHLVLVGAQSAFQVLWKALEEKVGPAGVQDLSERMILAMNGTNIYFTNDDLRRRREEDKHLEVTIRTNVLERANPRGTVRPAALCFLDSKRIVESGGRGYSECYAPWIPLTLPWKDSGNYSPQLLSQLGATDGFADNVAAVSDPDDCGQGFMVRALVDLIRDKGNILLIKKHLVRTHLIETAEELHVLLKEYYNEDGTLGVMAIREAFFACLKFLTEGEGDTGEEIERLCKDELDSQLDQLILTSLEREDWIPSAFDAMAAMLKDWILEKANVDPGSQSTFTQIYKRKVEDWADDWGYRTSVLNKPSTEGNLSEHRSFILLRHNLCTHAREILFQLTDSQSALQDLETGAQSPEEIQAVAKLMVDFRKLIDYADKLKPHYQF